MTQGKSVLELTTRIGEVLLKNGGEIFRVQQTMQIVAKAYGVSGFHVYVLANGLFVSIEEDGKQLCSQVGAGTEPAEPVVASQIRHVPLSSVHLGRVAAVNNLSREIAAHKYTVEQAKEKIEQIDQIPFTSNALQVLVSGVGAGAFCYLFGGSPLDCLASFISGLVLWVFVLFLTAKGANKIMVNILSSALVTAMGVLFSAGSLLYCAGSRYCAQRLSDAHRHHIAVKGEGRMLSLLAQTAVSFVATVSFAILFQVPREQYVYSGLCGAAGWLCYLLVMQNYPSPAVASFAAVVVLTVMSRIFAVRRKTPVTVFLICGIFPLVPGAGIYYTAYNFIIGNNQMAVAKGVETIKIAVAIALAVVFTFSLPTPVFRFAKSRKGR